MITLSLNVDTLHNSWSMSCITWRLVGYQYLPFMTLSMTTMTTAWMQPWKHDAGEGKGSFSMSHLILEFLARWCSSFAWFIAKISIVFIILVCLSKQKILGWWICMLCYLNSYFEMRFITCIPPALGNKRASWLTLNFSKFFPPTCSPILSSSLISNGLLEKIMNLYSLKTCRKLRWVLTNIPSWTLLPIRLSWHTWFVFQKGLLSDEIAK